MIPKSEKPTSEITIAEASNERFRKKPSGIIGFSDPRLPEDEGGEQDERDREPAEREDRDPGVRVRLDQAVDQREEAGGDEHRAGDVERRRTRILRLVDRVQRHDGGHDADRHVDPEDGRPVDLIDQEAAEQRPEREPERRDARPDADGGRDLAARERRDDDRERERVHQRATRALDRPERDQLMVGGRERAGRGGDREHDQADEEHALAAEAVAELAAEQDQRREREHVGVDRPLEAHLIRVERLLDRGERDVHDGVVEHDHEEGEAHRGERVPLAVRVDLGHTGAPPSGVGGRRSAIIVSSITGSFASATSPPSACR